MTVLTHTTTTNPYSMSVVPAVSEWLSLDDPGAFIKRHNLVMEAFELEILVSPDLDGRWHEIHLLRAVKHNDLVEQLCHLKTTLPHKRLVIDQKACAVRPFLALPRLLPCGKLDRASQEGLLQVDRIANPYYTVQDYDQSESHPFPRCTDLPLTF